MYPCSLFMSGRRRSRRREYFGCSANAPKQRAVAESAAREAAAAVVEEGAKTEGAKAEADVVVAATLAAPSIY
jgi:hypothetical protein